MGFGSFHANTEVVNKVPTLSTRKPAASRLESHLLTNKKYCSSNQLILYLIINKSYTYFK